MAFGQQGGPPATAKQVQALLALIQAAGHSDFRDARGPMGFTQRQAAGKFTRDEADAYIEQLEQEQDGLAPGASEPPKPTSKIVPRAQSRPASPPIPKAPIPKGGSRPASRPIPKAGAASAASASERALAAFSTEELAAELQRRGWVVLEP